MGSLRWDADVCVWGCVRVCVRGRVGVRARVGVGGCAEGLANEKVRVVLKLEGLLRCARVCRRVRGKQDKGPGQLSREVCVCVCVCVCVDHRVGVLASAGGRDNDNSLQRSAWCVQREPGPSFLSP